MSNIFEVVHADILLSHGEATEHGLNIESWVVLQLFGRIVIVIDGSGNMVASTYRSMKARSDCHVDFAAYLKSQWTTDSFVLHKTYQEVEAATEEVLKEALIEMLADRVSACTQPSNSLRSINDEIHRH